MKKKSTAFYLISLTVLLLASIYPIYMGTKVMNAYFQNGYIEVADYPKYVIPYTPISIALLTIAVVLPVLYKWLKKHFQIVASVLGLGLFFAAEIGFEQIKVLEGYETMELQSWQYSLCIATPEVLQAIGEPIYAENNPAFKVHFYLIAAVIVLTVVGILCEFMRMIRENLVEKRKPLIVQTICVVVFIGLCILACFTAFYRNGTLDISPLSAVLMTLFFVIFGVTFGTYFSCLFYQKKRWLSVVVPAITSSVTTLAMYIGELMLMDGVLFRYGSGLFFAPMGLIPFSPCDIAIILLAGLATWGISEWLNKIPHVRTV